MEEDRNLINLKLQITLLEDFYNNLSAWHKENKSQEKKKALRSKINKNLIAIKNLVVKAGTHRYITITVRGMGNGQYFEPFTNLFMYENGWDTIERMMDESNLINNVLNQVEQAIGVYEHIQSESGLIELNPKGAIDIESAIGRALRPSFRDTQPKSEKEIQDAIENILNALGIKFTRDREVTSVAGKAFKPDFIVGEIDLAIEVKLAKEGYGAPKIQESINADISAYRTKWKNLLFVVYDLGVINDPYKFQTENIKLFGISVRVIKH
jgi:hypothetical protein